MVNLRRGSGWVLILVSLVLLVILLISFNKTSFSPKDDFMVGCWYSEEFSSGPEEEIYGNCVADSFAYFNSELTGEDNSAIRNAMIFCLQLKGYNVPTYLPGEDGGIPVQNIDDAVECKKFIMKTFGITEIIDMTSRGAGGASSPFRNNCPPNGEDVIVVVAPNSPGSSGSGHSVMCTLKKCNPNTGSATLTCTESPIVPVEGAAGLEYTMNVASTGGVTITPPSSPAGILSGGVVHELVRASVG
ncbi:MAG: hypothetical protein Q8P57_04675 [Candidatus Pacearchaeota archaeon]|nr:hypothetical protein [Candidatus Pacearchaeota archaeon]